MRQKWSSVILACRDSCTKRGSGTALQVSDLPEGQREDAVSCEYQIPPLRGRVCEWTDQESCWPDDLASVLHDTSATAVAISVWKS